MYDPFFKEGIFSYFLFYILTTIFIYVFLRKIDLFKSKYAYKLSTLFKFFILILVSLFNIIILMVLDIANAPWIIGVAYNAFSATLTIYLTIALFLKKKNKFMRYIDV